MDLTLNTCKIRNTVQIYPFYVCFALIYWNLFFYFKVFGYFCKAMYYVRIICQSHELQINRLSNLKLI
mgnify:CR=1 FL=1|jgi:hypothetical protein